MIFRFNKAVKALFRGRLGIKQVFRGNKPVYVRPGAYFYLEFTSQE